MIIVIIAMIVAIILWIAERTEWEKMFHKALLCITRDAEEE